VTPSKFLPARSSFESIRKQAKRLVREFEAGAAEAVARVHAQLPVPKLPLSLRDAQLVLAREYGFAGWKDLRTAVLRQEGKGLEWAAAEAERAIHDNEVGRLAELVREYPALLAWRGDSGESLLGMATGSFGDSGDPVRERTFTRVECAEFLLDAGAAVEPAIWEDAIHARAKGVLQLVASKGALPRTLNVVAALGDVDGVQELMRGADAGAVTQAFLTASRFHHRAAAGLLLDRCVQFDSELGERIERWRGRDGFIDYLGEHGPVRGKPWLTVVVNELESAMHKGDLDEFTRWLEREIDARDESHVDLLVGLIENAAYNNCGPFIERMLEFAPGMRQRRRPSSAVVFALEYGNAHLIPLLTSIWPLADDLPHAAGTGDFARVRGWFDESGSPKLGNLNQHYPANDPGVLRNLHWIPANAQHVLDVALAWACVNRQFAIADFLLERGANINTNWSTHEPAGMLHECAMHARYETAQFLVDRGIDLTIRDYRWNATAKGWAIHAAKDPKMAELLDRAERARQGIG